MKLRCSVPKSSDQPKTDQVKDDRSDWRCTFPFGFTILQETAERPSEVPQWPHTFTPWRGKAEGT